jgi:hypothetical protein
LTQEKEIMKFLRLSFLILLVILLPYLLNSCGDDVVNPKNVGEFSVQNLKPLNTVVDGMYELWVSIVTTGDHDDNALRTLGKFNVSSTGSLIDKNGNTFQLSLSRVPDINKIADAIVTIEPPEPESDTIPSEARIMGGVKNVENGKLIFDLSMNYNEVLGSRADLIDNAPDAKYVLAAPTTGDTNLYKKGAWFSANINGTAAGLQLPVIPDTLGWWYEAWIVDTTQQDVYQFYDMGRFFNPAAADDNQRCDSILTSGWNLPGQDWIRQSCYPVNFTPITDLTAGKYKILVTLEPHFEQGVALSVPFVFKIYEGRITDQTYGTINSLTNIFDMPGGLLKLSLATNQ